MGLFSRKKSTKDARPSTRATTSSEAQAAELRARARRRLVGALVLVLAAVLIVPRVFDDPAETEQIPTPVVLPAVVPPEPDPDLALEPSEPGYTVDTTTPLGSDVDPSASELANADITLPDSPADAALSPEAPEANPDTGTPTTSEPAPQPEAKPESKPEPTPKPDPAEPAKPDRSDDGSVALALLEGRSPSQGGAGGGSAQQKGNFILQVAAYGADKDAQARRKSLIDAGVTNAYVEKGVSNDKTTYRLRVGSFPTREAAQAAQARLRALGYDNSLLLTQ